MTATRADHPLPSGSPGRGRSGPGAGALPGGRPAVAERLGIGPGDCRAVNPRLVYGRMTGWGQSGPLAHRAGHDINYIAVAGVLEPIGRADDRPVPPLNLVGDLGGGGMLLAVGILAALYERERSGLGRVVDAAMVDGAALLMAHCTACAPPVCGTGIAGRTCSTAAPRSATPTRPPTVEVTRR
ncbi:MAG: hypothetical protein JWL99_1639, partial [Streptomyces oryziradicis]|nr:hypothetical protein [Actinacidiphila oryziradicis]